MSVENASRQFLEKNKLEPDFFLVGTVRQSDWLSISGHNLMQLVRHKCLTHEDSNSFRSGVALYVENL